MFLYLTCRVLHTKSLLSSPQTLCAATTNTSTRNTKTMDSQILPNAVEYLLTPLNRLSSPDQFIPAAAALAWLKDTSAPCKTEEQRHLFTHPHHKIRSVPNHRRCIGIVCLCFCHITRKSNLDELWLRIGHNLHSS